MTPTLIIIGWLACSGLTCALYARRFGELPLEWVIASLASGPPGVVWTMGVLFFEKHTFIIWRRKPGDQSREDV